MRESELGHTVQKENGKYTKKIEMNFVFSTRKGEKRRQKRRKERGEERTRRRKGISGKLASFSAFKSLSLLYQL